RNSSGQTALHLAARVGRVNICSLLLEHGAIVDNADAEGKLALHYAAYGGYLDVARLLLIHNGSDTAAAQCCARTSSGVTALNIAVGSVKFEMCCLLLEHGALVDDSDEDGWTPLHHAVYHGSLDIVRTCRLLLEHGALTTDTDKNGLIPLHSAAQGGNLDVVRLFLTYAAPDDSDAAAPQYRACDSFGQTALHLAAGCGHAEICKLLLDHGGLVDDTDENGWTPLHLAALGGYLDVARLLLTYPAADSSDGATPRCRARDSKGQTALHMAATAGSYGICRLLLEHGALVDDADVEGRTPLHHAASSWSLDAARFLLTYPAIDGSDVTTTRSRVRDSSGQTALHKAARKGASEICSLLIRNGALVDDVDAEGKTSLDLAAHQGREWRERGGYVEICHDLLEHGAPVDDTDWNGSTPLHIASAAGNLEICNLLLERGAHVDRG
ncbi:ankyrin, partial [Peniophora sp. CONT]